MWIIMTHYTTRYRYDCEQYLSCACGGFKGCSHRLWWKLINCASQLKPRRATASKPNNSTPSCPLLKTKFMIACGHNLWNVSIKVCLHRLIQRSSFCRFQPSGCIFHSLTNVTVPPRTYPLLMQTNESDNGNNVFCYVPFLPQSIRPITRNKIIWFVF